MPYRSINKILLYTIFSLILIFSLNGKTVLADNNAKVINISENISEYDLTKEILVFQDSEKNLTISSIFNSNIQNKFKNYEKSKLSGETSDSAYWFEISLKNNSNDKNMILDISKPQLNDLKVYVLKKGKLIKEEEEGINYPFSKREVNNRNYIFNINMPSKEEETLVFRVEAKSYLQLPAKLYTYKSFIENEERNNLILGIYYGIMFIMLLYNLALYFNIKDKSYLWYCFFIASFSVMQLIWDGLAYQYIWPDFVFWNSKSNPFFIILTGAIVLKFTKEFLGVSKKLKKYRKIIDVIFILELISLIFIILMPILVATEISVVVSSISVIVCVIAVKLVGLEDRSGYVYIVSWLALIFGAALNILASYKILPINNITLYAPRVGVIINVVLLSMSLGDRINAITAEKVLQENQKKLLEKLHEVTKKITATTDINLISELVLKSICKITKVDNGMLLLKENGNYYVKAIEGYCSEKLKNKILYKLEEDIYFKSIISHKEVLILKNIKMSNYGIELHFKNFVGFPIFEHENNIGAILLYSEELEFTTKSRYEILSNFIGQVGISIENAKLFEKVEKMATIDGLTKVYNRTHFLTLAETAIKKHKDISLIMLDIDYFKKINDTYGHLIGDVVLQELAVKVKGQFESKHIVGRYGGEEFLILLKDIKLEEAYKLAENLRKKIENMKIETNIEELITFTISIGVANINKSILNIAQLIERADEAMYISKQKGRNKVSICNN